MAGGYSLFQSFLFDQTGRPPNFGVKRLGCLPSEAWKAKGGHLKPDT
jgi:hypothetical protein